mgnify:FL=1
MGSRVDSKLKAIAFRLRKIRELKGLTREQWCEKLGENSEYWGLIERGEQPISLSKLLLVCEVYGISIEDVVEMEYAEQDDTPVRKEIEILVNQCKGRQLDIIRKFIKGIAMTI